MTPRTFDDIADRVYADADGRVHVTRLTGSMMIGATWPLEDVRALVDRHGVEATPPAWSAFGALMCPEDGTGRGPLIIDTVREVA